MNVENISKSITCLNDDNIKFKGIEINSIISKDRKLWIKGIDITKLLGYKNVNHPLTENLKPRQKCTLETLIINGINNANLANPPETQRLIKNEKNTIYINESGLYRLLLKSRLPIAEEFQVWLEDDVLPKIRENGSYSMQSIVTDSIDENNFWKENSISNYNEKNVIYVAYIGYINNEKIYKFGKSEQVYVREFKQHKKYFDEFRMIHIEICDNMSVVEKELNRVLESKNLIRKKKINDKNQTELFTVTPQININNIIDIIKKLVESFPLQALEDSKKENKAIIEENSYLKTLIEDLKTKYNNLDIKYEKLNDKYENLNNKYIEILENKSITKTINDNIIIAKFVEDNISQKKILKHNETMNKVIKNQTDSIISETINNNTEDNTIVNEVINKKEEINEIIIEETAVNITNLPDFFDRYTEQGEDCSSNDKFRIKQEDLYNYYCEKCLEPIDYVAFNNYIKETLKIETKVCNWYLKSCNTWMGIKIKKEYQRETKLEIYLRNFIENKCKVGKDIYVDTKIFNDALKKYCEEKEPEIEAVKYMGITPAFIKKALIKFGYGYKEWIVEGKKHGYTGLTLGNLLTVKESVDKYIENCCDLSYGHKVKTTILWETYQKYIKKANINITISRKQFYDCLLNDIKLEKKYINKYDKGFVGIKLKT